MEALEHSCPEALGFFNAAAEDLGVDPALLLLLRASSAGTAYAGCRNLGELSALAQSAPCARWWRTG
ncbi:MAG: hypothetical protein QW067_10520 [Thermofilaceae archaeon]